jgi:hypothetical protein
MVVDNRQLLVLNGSSLREVSFLMGSVCRHGIIPRPTLKAMGNRLGRLRRRLLWGLRE